MPSPQRSLFRPAGVYREEHELALRPLEQIPPSSAPVRPSLIKWVCLGFPGPHSDPQRSRRRQGFEVALRRGLRPGSRRCERGAGRGIETFGWGDTTDRDRWGDGSAAPAPFGNNAASSRQSARFPPASPPPLWVPTTHRSPPQARRVHRLAHTGLPNARSHDPSSDWSGSGVPPSTHVIDQPCFSAELPLHLIGGDGFLLDLSPLDPVAHPLVSHHPEVGHQLCPPHRKLSGFSFPHDRLGPALLVQEDVLLTGPLARTALAGRLYELAVRSWTPAVDAR